MRAFELVEPATLREAAASLGADDSTIRPIAGGTAIVLMMKAGVFRPERLVSLRRIERRHAAIERTAEGGLHIGAMATLTALEHSADIRAAAPVIARMLRNHSNVRVRNVATVGGNLAHADPNMDMPPVLIALGARVTTISSDGERSIAVEDLPAGFYQTVLKPNELIAALEIPAQHARRSAYLKCTTRAAHDWPTLGIAVSLGDNDARIVISAATERPMRLTAAENEFRDPRKAAEAAADTVKIMPDARGSIPYKRQLVRVYVERALRAAMEAAS